VIKIINKLKEYRKKYKLTAKQLAEAVNTSRSNISMIETGQRRPNIMLAKRIADYFDTTIEYLFFTDCCPETRQQDDINCQSPTGTEGR